MKIFGLGILFTLVFACTDAADNERRSNSPQPTRSTRGAGVSEKAPEILKSQAFRDNGEEPLTYSQLSTKLSTPPADFNYRVIPNDELDHEDRIYRNNHEQKNCGIVVEMATINMRKNNCLNVNGDHAVWSGKEYGNAGEGDWALVFKNTKTDTAVWQDLTTSLLWATPAKPGTWNEASGTDVEAAQRICDTFNMLTNQEVKWMLPTRNEFLQADINGARFVLPKVDDTYWTATRRDRAGKAWAIYQKTGELKEVEIDMNQEVRCVGIPL